MGGGWTNGVCVCFFLDWLVLVDHGGSMVVFAIILGVFVWIRFKVRERQLFYKIGPPQVIEWSQRVINYNNSF